MTGYIVRRLISSLVLLLLIVTFVFAMLQVLPGDPARAILGGEFSSPTPEQLERVRQELGLDQPILVQYIDYVGSLFTLDFGTSFVSGESVASQLATWMGRTLQIAIPALLLAVVIGVSLGILAALTRKTIWDPIFSALALFGFSTPVFVTGILLVLLFAVTLGWLPAGGYVSPMEDFAGYIERAILPIITLSLPTLAVTMRMTRSSVLENAGLDYVRTARAKGLAEPSVTATHIMRNALLPVVTVVGLQFGNLVTGSVIIEFIFGWPGMGSLLLTALGTRDYPVIQGVMLLVAAAFILINFVTDLSYGVIDPRIRVGRGR